MCNNAAIFAPLYILSVFGFIAFLLVVLNFFYDTGRDLRQQMKDERQDRENQSQEDRLNRLK